MKREIRIWPDPMLRHVCEAVPLVTDEVRELLTDMAETMVVCGGAGLAAPQVGFALRLVTILVEKLDLQADKPITNKSYEVVKLVNPQIVERSAEMVEVEEGCLSLPGIREKTRRHARVRAVALDENGQRIEIDGDGMLAIALQHELEHLDGHVFVDQLSVLKRDVLARKFQKAKRLGMRYVVSNEPAPAN